MTTMFGLPSTGHATSSSAAQTIAMTGGVKRDKKPEKNDHERRAADLVGLEFREADQTGDGSMTFSGYAAVFDKLSLPLYDWVYGEYNERIARGAFEDVLNRDPDVHLVVGHDMSRVLARTRSKTLELREDPAGLRVFARIDPAISYANDLRIQMQRGDVDQMSFAFTVQDEAWLIENPETADERVIRTIQRIGEMFDVSVVAQGAYPQTDANLRHRLEAAAQRGLVAIQSDTNHLRRTNPSLVGDSTDDRTGPSPVGGHQMSRARRLEQMRQRCELAKLTA